MYTQHGAAGMAYHAAKQTHKPDPRTTVNVIGQHVSPVTGRPTEDPLATR